MTAVTPSERRASDDMPTSVTGPPTAPADGGRYEVDAVVSVGRYAVLEEIGRGGMGTVLRAYDPKLRREVALKRLNANLLDERAEARLVREAQAMAQLSDPNVVAIYDVDVADGGVTIVMEYVAGSTLRQWLRQRTRAWPEIVEAFIGAGRGLAAAHRAGLVHRDFKPGNVLVAPDGAIKVTDFGLAKGVALVAGLDLDEPRATSTVDPDRGPVSESTDGEALTRPDTVMGTPPYMAPEQHTGRPPDARADQYAYCVSLWAALNGRLPFEPGPTLLDDKLAGPPEWQRSTGVPRRVAAAIERGLAPSPSDRWPSMDALLAELGHDPRTRRRRIVALAATGTGLALVAAIAALGSSAPSPCGGAGTQIAEVWHDETRAQVRAAITATEVAFAAATADRVDAYLVDYTDAWTLGYRDACEATSVRKEQSQALMDLRMTCLEHAKTRLAAVIGVLEQADADVVRRAVALVRGLPAVDHCADTVALGEEVPPPSDPGVAAAVEAQRARLARARALGGAGKYAEALALAGEVASEAERLGFSPFIAEAQAVQGAAALKDGRYDQSYEALDDAMRIALASRDDRLAVGIAADLTLLTADRLGRPEEGHAWANVALGLALAHDPGGDLEAEALSASANVARAEGKHDEAVRLYERVLEIDGHLHANDEGRKTTTMVNLAIAFKTVGRYQEAERLGREALEIIARVQGPDHPMVASTMNTVAGVLLDNGDPVGAEALLRKSVELRRRVLGPDHPLVAATLDNLAAVLANLGRVEEAEQVASEAYEIASQVLAPDNPELALFNANLGMIRAQAGKVAEALPLLERAVEIQQSAFSPDHPSLVQPLLALADALVVAGRPDDAIARYEHAWRLSQSDNVAPRHAARAGLSLADALWAVPADRARARAIVETARERLVQAGEDTSPIQLAKVDAWLSEHAL